MGKENCIFVDKKGNWWVAEAEIFGDGEINLIEEKTKQLTCSEKEEFVSYLNAVAPYLLYENENGAWEGVDASNRTAILKQTKSRA